MGNSENLVKELILPEAISIWKNRWTGSPKFAEYFKFWRTRHFLVMIMVGIPLIYHNSALYLFWIIGCCVFDYIILRSKTKKHFQKNLEKLEALLKNGLNAWDKNREDTFNYFFGEGKIISSSPAHVIRKAWVSELATKNSQKDVIILDAGCKDGESAEPLSMKGASIVGIDLNMSDLKIFNGKIKQPVIQSNILNLPFKNKIFDTILLLEVIEHLNNPLQGLNEVIRVLKPGGIVVLSTDNRNHINALDILNPIIIFEKALGLVFQNILRPKSLLWEYGENIQFYHTSFSKMEILALIRETKLRVVSFCSYFFLPGLHKLIGKINPDLTQNDYLRIIFPIEKIFVRLPIIKELGDHWFIVLKKAV